MSLKITKYTVKLLIHLKLCVLDNDVDDAQ